MWSAVCFINEWQMKKLARRQQQQQQTSPQDTHDGPGLHTGAGSKYTHTQTHTRTHIGQNRMIHYAMQINVSLILLYKTSVLIPELLCEGVWCFSLPIPAPPGGGMTSDLEGLASFSSLPPQRAIVMETQGIKMDHFRQGLTPPQMPGDHMHPYGEICLPSAQMSLLTCLFLPSFVSTLSLSSSSYLSSIFLSISLSLSLSLYPSHMVALSPWSLQ